MNSKLNGTFAVLTGAALAAGLALAPALAWGGGTDTMNGARAQQNQKYGKLTQAEVNKVISNYKSKSGALNNYFNDAYGYAVFPSVGTGPKVVGNHHGTGAVYQDGKLVGDSTVVKMPMGAHTGGQTFSELIFFQNKHAFEMFTEDRYHFHGNLTAADVHDGMMPSSTRYSNGMAVFVNTKSGMKNGMKGDMKGDMNGGMNSGMNGDMKGDMKGSMKGNMKTGMRKGDKITVGGQEFMFDPVGAEHTPAEKP